MIKANIIDLRNSLSRFLLRVTHGEDVLILKRNVPIARITGVKEQKTNKTKLGCGKGSVRKLVLPTEPFLDGGDWEMLSPKMPKN